MAPGVRRPARLPPLGSQPTSSLGATNRWLPLRDEVPSDSPEDWMAPTSSSSTPDVVNTGSPVCHLRSLKGSHQRALKVMVTVLLSDGSRHELPALVDTGAEYNLCNPRHLRTDLWQRSERPITLLAANESVVTGGSMELLATLEFKGRARSLGRPKTIPMGSSFYQADVGAPIILSYGWLARNGIVVYPTGDALILRHQGQLAWIRGIGHEFEQEPPFPLDTMRIHAGASSADPRVPQEGDTLRVRVTLTLPTAGKHVIQALVDSGLEYNLSPA